MTMLKVRINDMHRIASRYIDSSLAEQKAFEEQISGLPDLVKIRLENIIKNYNSDKKNKVYTIT